MDTARARSVEGIRRASTVVAAEGATPSPRPTNARDAHNHKIPVCAAGGAIKVLRKTSLGWNMLTHLCSHVCSCN